MKRFACTWVLLLFAAACTGKGPQKKTIWIYASTYKEVIALYNEALEKAFPDVEIKWYQAGSETVSAKVLAEMQGQRTQADLMMTSDLFFYQEMKRGGHLAPLPPATLEMVPEPERDPDGTFVVMRYPVMVLAAHQSIPEAERPKSFEDLLLPKWKNKVTLPSPLESGSSLTAILQLNRLYGEAYFRGLRRNQAVAAGGNGAVLARLQSGEFPVGMILMENILQAREKGQQSVNYIVPSEGAIPIPSPMAVFKSSSEPELAQSVLKWFLSPEAQDILVQGWLYSVLPDAPPPRGGPAWRDLKLISMSLTDLEALGLKRQTVKDLFQQTVLQ